MSRYLVISDLHSNAEALKAVIARMRRKKFQRVICLGDFVGYGAQPNQVLVAMQDVFPAMADKDRGDVPDRVGRRLSHCRRGVAS